MIEKNLEVSKMYSGMSEREVLGSIILDETKISKIITYLPTIQVFYMEDHQKYGLLYIACLRTIKQ